MADKIQLLLVEDDENLQEAFLFYIHQSSKINLAGMTGSQTEALNQVLKGKIDAILLDLELEEGDGINFLEELNNLGASRPLVVVFTNNRSSTVNHYIKELGADFVCYKGNRSYSPERVLGLIVRMSPYHHKKNKHMVNLITLEKEKLEKNRRERIRAMILALGVKTGSRREGYLTEAIYLAAYELEENNFLLQEVYTDVAKRMNTKGTNVEKGIRDTIEKVWKDNSMSFLEELYPFPVSKDTGCPTNSEFIRNMAEKFRKLTIDS